MADKSQQTEKPTQKRVDDARKKGQFLSARQFIGGAQFVVFVYMLGKWGPEWVGATREMTRDLLARAFGAPLTAEVAVRMAIDITLTCFVPLMVAGGALVLLTVALQLGLTKMGFALSKLAPDFKRLSPLSKIKELPRQNLPAFFQAAVLLPLFGWAVYVVASTNMDANLALPVQSTESAMAQVGSSVLDLLWKAAAALFVVGAIDLLRQLRRYSKDLRMSKQEIRDEMKETEGNPQIKARVRRLQRDNARKRMMQAIPTATAVVVNPTHFAVAIRYVPETMAAPLVVAKGKNYVALRIRKRALEHQVPLVENPPLAQALYKSVDVGQEIPPHLYRAVAEILAYIFKISGNRGLGR